MPLLSLKERSFSCWEGELFSRFKHWQQGGAHGGEEFLFFHCAKDLLVFTLWEENLLFLTSKPQRS